jgi:uncharacterized protein YjiS (DUF1127 family)
MHISRDLPRGTTPLAATLPGFAPPRHAPTGLWPTWLGTAMKRLREREELRALTPRERRDAGLTDLDAARLLRKPLWRP